MQAPGASTKHHPELEVHGGSSNIYKRKKRTEFDERLEEEQASTRPAEPTAYEHPQGIVTAKVAQRGGSVQRNSSVWQEAAQERTTGSTDTKGRSSQKHRLSPDKRWNRNQAGGAARAAAAAVTVAGQSPALGVKVIDRGTTKHLVLTAATDATGGDPGRAGDRPRAAAAVLLVPRRVGSSRSSSEAGDSRHHEPHQPHHALDPSAEKRMPVFQDDELRTAAASVRSDATVSLRGTEKKQVASARRVDVAAVGGGGISHTPPPKGLSAEVAAKQCAQSWEHHPFVADNSGTKALQPAAAAAALPRFASDMAPVFSVGERVLLREPPPMPEAAPPSIDSLNEDPWGAASSPASRTSSDTSVFLGAELTVKRTAKYVQQQASFHDDGSEDFVDDSSTSSAGEKAGLASPRRAIPAAATAASMLSIAAAAAAKDRTVVVSTLGNARPPDGWVKVEEYREDVKPAPSLSPSRPPPAAAASWASGAQGGHRSHRTGVEIKTRRVLTVPGANDSHPESPRRQAKREVSDAPWGTQHHPPTASVNDEGLARNEYHQDQNLLDIEGAAPPEIPRQPGSRAGRPGLLSRSIEVSSSGGGGGFGGNLHHFRANFSRHLLSGGRPALFFLRPNESLAVTRIEGDGRLLVTLREEAGAAGLVVVDGAVVHDSAAHFGNAAIQASSRHFSRVVPNNLEPRKDAQHLRLVKECEG